MNARGSRFILIGVLLLVLSVGTLVWSNVGEWLHQAQRPAAPPTESLSERFNVVTPPAARTTSATP